ncbi:Acid-sensing ion channel 2-like protein [Aphelenchoides besseyi]|nr:Acid-sensing ion channel 2-like protein [Aphelenchoides besseyi]
MWRRYNIDYSMTPYTGSSEFYEKVRMEREDTWRYIDNLIENSTSDVYASRLTQEMRRLFRDYFSATLLLGKIVQSTQVIWKTFPLAFRKRNKPIPVSKSCAEVLRELQQKLSFLLQSPLMEDARQKVEELLSWIHAIETNTTNRNGTVGFANTVRDDSHPIPTKFIRYYSNPKNIALLGDYFDKLYELITTLRNRLVPGSVCGELVVSVRKFLTEKQQPNRKLQWLAVQVSTTSKRFVCDLLFVFGQNFMAIRVRFRHIYGEVISRADEYTAFRLIADLGGTFGLYFGLSILTFYEFLMFVFVKDAAEGTVKAPKRNQIYNLKERNQSVYELQVPPRPF